MKVLLNKKLDSVVGGTDYAEKCDISIAEFKNNIGYACDDLEGHFLLNQAYKAVSFYCSMPDVEMDTDYNFFEEHCIREMECYPDPDPKFRSLAYC